MSHFQSSSVHFTLLDSHLIFMVSINIIAARGLLVHKKAMDNLHDLALNITHVHTASHREAQLCRWPHQYACCVADKGVSNEGRLGMLRFTAATEFFALSLMFLMLL